MQKSACVNTRVDPKLKSEAEAVLDELGISMATAISLYLKQIVIQNGIPFELTVPKKRPVSLDKLSDEEFNAMIDAAYGAYKNGKAATLADFERELRGDGKHD